MQEIQRDLDAGNLQNIYVRSEASADGRDIPMSESQAMQQHQQQKGVGMQPEHPEDGPPNADDISDALTGPSSPEKGATTRIPMPASAAAAEMASPSADEVSDDLIGSLSPETEGSAAEAAAAPEEGRAQHGGTSPGHDRSDSPAAGSSERGRVGRLGDERVGEQKGVSISTEAAMRGETSGVAAPKAEPRTEQQSDSHAREQEAEKLAKQQQLFGNSFSKPRR